MAYSKLWAGCAYDVGTRGLPIGFRTVNQLNDNLDFVRDAMSVTHAQNQNPLALTAEKLGRHMTPKVAKSTLYVSMAGGTGARVTGVGPREVAMQAFYVSTGVVQVVLQSYTTFWVDAQPVQSAYSPRFVEHLLYQSSISATAQAPLLELTARELSAGDFVPTAFDFCVTIFATG